MEKVGILIVSKCLSSAAIIDTFLRSEKYEPEFYVAEKQANPFNLERAKVHKVIPDLNVSEIVKFAAKYTGQISFGLTDTEDFVTAGGRDVVEREASVPMVCVTREYAVERSKADQRLLFEEIFPNANPRYKVFDPKATSEGTAISELKGFTQELGAIVIKPDAPARGAGVGVWGSEFKDVDGMVGFFLKLFSKGRVVVEEKIEGEESSFQAFSDGRNLFPAPLTRDYKRAFDGNQGRLTGGMGSYRDTGSFLPFLRPSEWERIVRAEKDAFRRWKGRGSNLGLRGIVLYDALMHTGRGFKVLERNSRGGNTEQVSILTTMEDDFVDVCYRMIDGRLRGIRFSREASVVTCAVPTAYGTSESEPTGDNVIDLSRAYRLQDGYNGNLRIFPMDARLEDGKTRIGTSRSVAVAGIASTLEGARAVSLVGIDAIKGSLRSRRDIGSRADVLESTRRLKRLRARR